MFKITNIEALGEDYTVADSNGSIIKTIQVIPHDEILEAALGEWDETESLASYLEKSVAVLEGFDIIEPNTTCWYSTNDNSIKLAEVLKYAIKHGYDRIILEYLDSVDKNGTLIAEVDIIEGE